MLLREINEQIGIQYYHGSYDYLPVGTILTPRHSEYEKDWEHTWFYKILEKYKPENALGHKESVFMVADPEDVGLAGGAEDYIFTVEPIGKVEKHDLNWSSEIESLISDEYTENSPEVIEAANNYWSGKPHHLESVWEYLTPKAKIVSVEEG